MTGASALILAAALATGPPAGGPGASIRWEVDAEGRARSVAVEALGPADLAPLRAPGWTPDRWPGVLAVTLDLDDLAAPGRPAMLGSYRLEGSTLRFVPRYPLDRGRRYRATYRPPGGPEARAAHREPKPDRPRTALTRVEPSGDRLPENLLKFYLHFSAPMARGEAYDRVRLLKEDGTAVDLPFLRVGEELWDPSGTRLTLLIDPGRIKRGLKPREEHGPVLEAGHAYTLAVDPGWPDAEGDPLALGFRRGFRAGPADESQPDPKSWTVGTPAAGTREPLTLRSPEPLDSALLRSALDLLGPGGEPVEGRAEILDGATCWQFTPAAPWTAGDFVLRVEDDLEDLAGNSLRRPFEVDIRRDTPARPGSTPLRLPIAIRPR